MSEEKKSGPQGNQRVLRAQVGMKGLLYDVETKKFLVLKAAQDHYNEELSPWENPGGRVDEGEKDLDASLMRELREEIGEEVTFDNKGIITQFMGRSYGNEPYVISVYLLYYTGGEIILSEEHEEFKWIDDIAELACDKSQRLEEIYKKAQARIQEIEAQGNMLRVLAEFDNYKKRSAENQKEFAQYASEKVIMEMLPVLDNFHAATEHIPEDQADSPWLTGIMYIQQQMEKVFEDSDVRAIDIKEGDTFDPETMEAIQNSEKGEVESATDEEENEDDDKEQGEQKVIKVVQKGYKIKEKVMRPARVTVGLFSNS